MKKIAVMQPYVFPYIGYFQLIHAVDTFVFYDDVNFIKQGWINRNKILMNGTAYLFTIPCKGISSFKRINEVELDWNNKNFEKLMKSIEASYHKAPYYLEAISLVTKILNRKASHIHELAISSIQEVCAYLKLKKKFKISSKEEYAKQDGEIDRAERLVQICKVERGTHYINALGGQQLYDKSYFQQFGLTLEFLQPHLAEYAQFNHDFTPALSIIDVLMFNSPTNIVENLLPKYRLI